MSDRPVDNEKNRFKVGTGLVFESEDGDFSLKPRLRAQFFYGILQEESIDEDSGEVVSGDAQQSFQLRRARLQFQGHVFGRDNKFKTEFAFSPRDMGARDTTDGSAPQTSPLLDWYLDFTQVRDLNVRVGQSKVPFNRQRVTSSGDLQMVDRSIVNGEFTVDRDIGVDFRSDDLFGLDVLRYYVGAWSGEGRNTAHHSTFDMMYIGRLEFMPFGSFEDYKEADLERHPTPKLSIGAAYAALPAAYRVKGTHGAKPGDGGTTDMNLGEADLMFKYQGLSVLSEFIVRDGKRNAGDAVDDDGDAIAESAPRNGYGWMVQAGYLFPTTRFELAGRWGMIRATDDDSALEDQNEVGGSISYYVAHHPLKIQADFFHYTTGDQDLRSNEFRVQLQSSF